MVEMFSGKIQTSQFSSEPGAVPVVSRDGLHPSSSLFPVSIPPIGPSEVFAGCGARSKTESPLLLPASDTLP